jgi:heparanase
MFVVLFALAPTDTGLAQSTSIKPLTPSNFSKLGTVDERFQSYNVEMVEVTGGRFWAPYKQADSGPAVAPDTHPATTPSGMPPSLYRYRTPIDLTSPRLRKLAAALGPAYIRVSGTWANTTYFQDTDEATPGAPPPGFGGVLTRAEWKNVIDFSKAVDARIVTSFAIGAGVRDSNGVWTSEQAEKWLRFTSDAGGSIALAEFFNEPTYASMGGAPKGYDAVEYGRDFKLFSAFLRKFAPAIQIVGPGSVGEGGALGQQTGMPKLIKSDDLLTAEGPGLDGFSYHFYGSVSQRCAMGNAAMGTTAENALSADWLTRTEIEEEFYAALRNRFEPGKTIWLTETGETACGGNPWASTFIDSFRYLHQLGSLARLGVRAVMHNTLAASDYGLIDESTLNPRPNYWAALLWSRLMGATVLDAGPASGSNQYLYAHCLKHHPGGVAVLAINADRTMPQTFSLASPSHRFTLTARDLLDNTVELNGKELSVGSTGDLPKLEGVSIQAGSVQLPPASISFFAIPGAGNASCR